MEIHVVKAAASGNTELSAFDKALNEAGVANFNLIRLSSVIPPGSKVVEFETNPPKTEGEWGDRLYVVRADNRTAQPGVEVWAGIGWVVDEATGKGLFVEHEGESKGHVERNIESSLTQMMEIRGIDYGEIHKAVAGILCEKDPVCALVLAVYRSESW